MSTDRIEKLKVKEAQIKANIKRLSAREREKKRKQQTRRKIIAGALALNHLEKNPKDEFSQKLRRLLDEYVVKDYERKLFDLPPLPSKKEKPSFDNANDDILDLGKDFNKK